jgi:ATP-dependent DNA ligase
MNAKTLGALPKAEIHFIEPMYARLVNQLPEGREWLYEVKFDGYRCLAGRHSSAVALWSRRESSFTKQFPQIAEACERLPPNTLIDGAILRHSKFIGLREDKDAGEVVREIGS